MIVLNIIILENAMFLKKIAIMYRLPYFLMNISFLKLLRAKIHSQLVICFESFCNIYCRKSDYDKAVCSLFSSRLTNDLVKKIFINC